MSMRYPGAIISATPPTTSATSASGSWTLEQQMQAQAAGNWPFGGPFNYIEDVFSTWLYTGTGPSAGQTITNSIDLSTNGGMVWIKNRTDSGTYPTIIDTVRGATKELYTNQTVAQSTVSNGLTAFTTSGFTLGTDTAGGNVNYAYSSPSNFASWTFRKQPKFFDVVTYTGNGTSGRTIAHNLGSVPGCVIIKRTNSVANWAVYHRGLTSGANWSLLLNSTVAQFNTDNYWNSTAPTSTNITLGDSNTVNGNGSTYVAYIFAHNAGGFGLTGTDNVISCGSYTGSGGTATVTLGYEPQWVLIKQSNAGGDWYLFDNMRGIVTGGTDPVLFPNNANAEDTGSGDIIDVTATGFNIKSTLGGSGDTYIYIAIRHGPMKTPTSGTSVFAPVAYTGNGSTNTLTTNFPVDMYWNKTRTAGPGSLMDRIRNQAVLRTEETLSESSIGTYASTTNVWQNNTGLSFGSGGVDGLNENTVTVGLEAFRRAPGFFDVVCYTGNGAAGTTISHNLTVAPEMMIVKARNYTGGRPWPVYHIGMGNTKFMYLNTTAAEATNTWWNDTTPTASVFTIGSNSVVNFSGTNYVAYLFATVAGVSKVGSYTGTGTTLQVNCGFTSGSRFVLIKRTDDVGDWYVWDSARGIVSGNDPYLLLNSAAAEVTNTDYVDTYSAGFEISSTAPAAINANGGTFIFLAIA